MTTTSRGISQRTSKARPSHTPGRDKKGNCVRSPDAMLACSANPYKGAGLKGESKAKYNRFWKKAFALNGIKKAEPSE